MRIGLYGIRGVFNFGCEAIVRGTALFIKEVIPDAEIVYFSHSYEFDKKALADVDITVVPINEKYNYFIRAINKFLKIIGFERRVFPFDVRKAVENIDLIFSIGGDIYTIPTFIREHKKYAYYNSLIDFCDRCKKPIIVYGASVGPWGNYIKAVNYYKKNMSKYKGIICREKEAVDYLQTVGISNSTFSPDPAFLLGEGINYRGKRIGINLSPLSIKELYGDCSDVYIERLSKVVDGIIEATGKEVIFLPHVLSPSEDDNDLLFLEKIRERMKHSDCTSMAEYKRGFLGIKEAIRTCYIVVAARMHCAVNAIEESVPTIFLSYSNKSIGMSEYVYGNRKWTISLSDIEEKLIPLVGEMCREQEELTVFLEARNKKIRNDFTINVEQIKKLFHENNYSEVN